MTHQDYISLFNSMHPDFFERKYIRSIPKREILEDMILSLDAFNPNSYGKELDKAVSFGFYEGDRKALLKLVETVEEGWVQYYQSGGRVYCGYVNGAVASFCLAEDMGTHRLGGQNVRIGGPGCVGTLPQYRNQGIGLTMVKHVTSILRKEGYDYSYIHYTGVAGWYAKLGYQTCVRWTRDGIVKEAAPLLV